MSVLLETITPPESGLININLTLTANIKITSLVARRQVTLHVTHHIADLLHGELPHLVWRQTGVYWRVPVALSAPTKGRIGIVGSIDVDVETGKLIITEEIIHAIEKEAMRLAKEKK